MGSFPCWLSGRVWGRVLFGHFLGFYGPNDNNVRRRIWDELIGIQQYWDVLWCYIGDFNIVHFPSEWLGDLHPTSTM